MGSLPPNFNSRDDAVGTSYPGPGHVVVDGFSSLHGGDIDLGLTGSAGTLTVSNVSTVVADGRIVVGAGGSGTLTVQGEDNTIETGSALADDDDGIVFGAIADSSGTGLLSGTGTTLKTNGHRIVVGDAGYGSLTIAEGARAEAGNFTEDEAAVEVASAPGSIGTLRVTAQSILTAYAPIVVGGHLSGGTLTAGGTGTLTVDNSGTILGIKPIIVETGSTFVVTTRGGFSNPLILAGGSATLAGYGGESVTFMNGGSLTVGYVLGANMVSGFSWGDTIDFASQTNVTPTGNVAATASGSMDLGPPPTGATYFIRPDGGGGTYVAVTPQTIAVFRFFDTQFGTHFYTADSSEAATIQATRLDLVQEAGQGGGLSAISPLRATLMQCRCFASSTRSTAPTFSPRAQPNATRFSQAVPTSPMSRREASSKHATRQLDDTPVYRLFDTTNGTHFYTDSSGEFASVQATRPDLVYEGVGFYEPLRSASA